MYRGTHETRADETGAQGTRVYSERRPHTAPAVLSYHEPLDRHQAPGDVAEQYARITDTGAQQEDV